MKTIICGAGKMGRVIGFAMKKAGYEVSIVETNKSSIEDFFKLNGSVPVYSHWSEINDEVNIFISALPYHATLEAAKWCISKGIRYCDLGGSVPVSKEIADIAKKDARMPVMTDLGLAPGWVNLIAEEAYRSLPGTHTIEMMVGGIPESPNFQDPLKYKLTWSFDGLMNEYVDDCVIIHDGEIRVVRGMDDLELVTVNGMQFEAFNTSGAAAHSIEVMAKRGVKHCKYKTMRWPGHCNVMKYLLMGFSQARDVIEHMLKVSDNLHKDSGDMVVINVIARNGGDGSFTTKTISNAIYGNKSFSAMQRATAIPLVAVADLMAIGDLDKHKCLTYADIPLDSFNESLNHLFKV